MKKGKQRRTTFGYKLRSVLTALRAVLGLRHIFAPLSLRQNVS
jgi:hypothetical protein